MNRFLMFAFVTLIPLSLWADDCHGLSKNPQRFKTTQIGSTPGMESQNKPGSQGKIAVRELLRLGVEEGDENQVFFKANDVLIDDKGNIYVLDAGNHRIQKFDKEGLYLLTIGQKGQGPGEMIMPIRMQWDSRGNIVVFDTRLSRVSKFTPEGEFVNSFATSFLIWDGIVDAKDNVYLHGRYNGNLIHKFDPEGEHLLSFMEEIKSGKKADMEIEAFLNHGKLVITSENQIILALPSPYSLFFFDLAGKLIGKMDANVSYNVVPYIGPGGFSITRFDIAGLASWSGFSVCLVIVHEDFPEKVDENFIHQLQSDPFKFLEGYESYMDIFNQKGNFIAHKRIGKLIEGGRFDNAGNLYILENVPFSQLVKYQIDLPKQ